MDNVRHILVPVDFSETACEALRLAYGIARDTPSRLSVLYVISDVWLQPWATELTSTEWAWRENAHARLRDLCREHGLDEAGVTTAVLVGPPAATIVHYAEEHGVDLIVVGAHGHGRIHHALLGSVAERVVRTARCAVLTVPLPTHRTTSPSVAKAASSAASTLHERKSRTRS